MTTAHPLTKSAMDPDLDQVDGQGEIVLEGIFAIDKPSYISSAQVLLDIKAQFEDSQIFALLEAETARKQAEQDEQRAKQGYKSKLKDERAFKMGHGGTLDPLASGVLIIGIGRGTKYLSALLGCKKTYETVVLFGVATDTYDVMGEVVDTASASHITQALVEEELQQFRGPTMQVPPAFSALKINGIKACEYARAGVELPRELEGREMQVDECTLMKWYEAGEHDFAVCAEDELSADSKSDAKEVGPAALVRLTVSSGFYVRSFAHDLGVACSSLSTMAALRRTQQDIFVTSEPGDSISPSGLTPCLTYPELQAGETVWGPRVKARLTQWMKECPAVATVHVNGRDRQVKEGMQEEDGGRLRQRFLGGRQADTRKERRRQQKDLEKAMRAKLLASTAEAPSSAGQHAEG